MYENIFKNVTIYRLYITQTIDGDLETYQVFENNDLQKVKDVMTDYQGIDYFKDVSYNITSEDVFHNTIEDGYYTYSHIYESGHVVNFSLYTMLHDNNIAEIITEWFTFITKYESHTTHYNYVHNAYANSSDGLTDFSYTNVNNDKLYHGVLINQNKNAGTNPLDYKWEKITDNEIFVDSSTKFTYTVNVYLELQQIIGNAQAINKRNRRYDSWAYEKNKDYPFIGGYES